MPEVNVDYIVPVPLPDIPKCILVTATTNFVTGVVTGLCVQQDAAGATNGPPINFELPLNLADLGAIATPLVAALQAAGIVPAGPVVVNP